MNNALAIAAAAVIGFGGGYFAFTPSTAEVPAAESVATEPQAIVVEEAAPAAEPAPIVEATTPAEVAPAPAGTEAAAAGAPTEEVK
jgi:hypothetical protein